MKIKYEDWENGKIAIYSPYDFSEQLDNIKHVYWVDIEHDVQLKIETKQKEIFDEICEEELNRIISEFDSKYSNSSFKELFIINELKKIEEVLFNETNSNNENQRYVWGSIQPFCDTGYFKEIRRYFNLMFIEGNTIDYNFINSPLLRFLKEPLSIVELFPEIQVVILNQFYIHLKNLKNGVNLKFDKTFWNLQTFELFKYLSENYINYNTIAKYNKIHHYLKYLNKNEVTNYQFKMLKKTYFEYVKNEIDSNFTSQKDKNKKPSMNPPETDEKDTAFTELNILKCNFENNY